MATLRDIRNRIRSIKNTQQITRAMKMVSAAKLRRAQDMAVSGRDYHRHVASILGNLALAAGPEGHRLFRPANREKIDVILVTSDKGLCGSFNANLIKRTLAIVHENPGRVSLIAVGKKGRDFFGRLDVPLVGEFVDTGRSIGLPLARRISGLVLDRLARGEADTVILIYSRFVSVLTQYPVELQLFPLAPADAADAADTPAADYLFEPSRGELIDRLVPLYADIMAYQALLETTASEHGARMSAMDSATKNAGELIGRLTLFYNRARQAAITKELIEVVSGADALEG